MSPTLRLIVLAGAGAVPLAPAAVRAQASPTAMAAEAGSLAYPRQLVSWVFSAQGDSAFAHADPALREKLP